MTALSCDSCHGPVRGTGALLGRYVIGTCCTRTIMDRLGFNFGTPLARSRPELTHPPRGEKFAAWAASLPLTACSALTQMRTDGRAMLARPCSRDAAELLTITVPGQPARYRPRCREHPAAPDVAAILRLQPDADVRIEATP